MSFSIESPLILNSLLFSTNVSLFSPGWKCGSHAPLQGGWGVRALYLNNPTAMVTQQAAEEAAEAQQQQAEQVRAS